MLRGEGALTPEPMVVDARDGLSRAALRELRQAHCVMAGIKTAVTGVVGCWSQTADPSGQQVERFSAILIRNSLMGSVEGEQRFTTIPDAHATEWRRFVRALKAGDVLTADSYRTPRIPIGQDGVGDTERLRAHAV